MREIKFRAWDGVMYGWEEFLQHDDFNFIMANHTHELSTFTLLQFTGLRDKHGVEIYEGDILNVCNGSINGTGWFNKPYAVDYVLNKGFNMCMFCWNEDGSSRMNSTHWCEVIGNIYENPELLQEGR